MSSAYKRFISLISTVLFLVLPVISYASLSDYLGGGGAPIADTGRNNPNQPGGTNPPDTISGNLANNYSADEIDQLKAAWVASGRSLTPSTDFDYAVNYASLMGMPAADFLANVSNPSWNPYNKYSELKNAWLALGYAPGDFSAGLQAALAAGRTADEFLADLQKEAADLAKQYQDLLDRYQLFSDLYNHVVAAMANGDPIDWDEVARQLGIEPPYTPDDIWSKLQDLNALAGTGQNWENDRRNLGMTPSQYMNHLLGRTSNDHGAYCFDSASGTSCEQQARNKIDDILNRPNTAPPPNNGNDNGGDINEPLVGDTTDKTLLDNIRADLPSIVRMIFALSYTIGVAFVIVAVMRLKHMGESRSGSMQHQGGMMGVTAYLIVGTMLIYLPSALNISVNTLLPNGGDASLFAYSNATAGLTFENLMAAVLDIVKVLGLIAFVRGWVLLAKIGGQSSQSNAMSKGMVHIIAGILAVNIITTWKIIQATFDFYFTS